MVNVCFKQNCNDPFQCETVQRPIATCRQYASNIKKVDHLIFQCKRLKNDREILKNSVLEVGNWPVSKSELTNRNLKQLIRYIN